MMSLEWTATGFGGPLAGLKLWPPPAPAAPTAVAAVSAPPVWPSSFGGGNDGARYVDSWGRMVQLKPAVESKYDQVYFLNTCDDWSSEERSSNLCFSTPATRLKKKASSLWRERSRKRKESDLFGRPQRPQRLEASREYRSSKKNLERSRWEAVRGGERMNNFFCFQSKEGRPKWEQQT